jgi:hypothetical protein
MHRFKRGEIPYCQADLVHSDWYCFPNPFAYGGSNMVALASTISCSCLDQRPILTEPFPSSPPCTLSQFHFLSDHAELHVRP